jgi:hypothetical protein
MRKYTINFSILLVLFVVSEVWYRVIVFRAEQDFILGVPFILKTLLGLTLIALSIRDIYKKRFSLLQWIASALALLSLTYECSFTYLTPFIEDVFNDLCRAFTKQ